VHEPSELLDEVVDANGKTWIRYHTDPTGKGRHWWSNNGGGWAAFSDLAAPTQPPSGDHQ
jgi:hypothetical protein